jgi:hypothetical protein
MLFERLEVSEKKRQETLSANRDLLSSKLELERLLKLEKRKVRDILEGGKGSHILMQRVAELEAELKSSLAREREQ